MFPDWSPSRVLAQPGVPRPVPRTGTNRAFLGGGTAVAKGGQFRLMPRRRGPGNLGGRHTGVQLAKAESLAQSVGFINVNQDQDSHCQSHA